MAKLVSDEQNRRYLVERLCKVADEDGNHVDGSSRIKVAVMAAYLSGRPAPTKDPPLTGFLRLQQEFGIELTDTAAE